MKNKTIYGLIALLLVMIAILCFYMFRTNDAVPSNDFKPEVYADQVFAYTDNGDVSLYDVKNGAQLDAVDLNARSNKKDGDVIAVTTYVADNNHEESAIDSNVTQNEEAVKKSGVKPSQKDEFEGFIEVPVVIKKGQNAWSIQSQLTPKRNISVMLHYVMIVNKRDKLHPIYTGERIIFLKEKSDDKPITPSPTPSPSPSPTSETTKQDTDVSIPSKIETNTITVTKDKRTYVFAQDEETYATASDSDARKSVLFAYSNVDQTLYRLASVSGKVNVIPIGTNAKYGWVSRLYAESGKLFLVQKDSSRVMMVNADTGVIEQQVDLAGIPEQLLYTDNTIYYTYNDRIGKLNVETNEFTSALLGDQSLDLLMLKDQLIVLNQFGSKMDNSLLMSVNPADMNVANLLELKSDSVAVLSHGLTDSLYVGRIEKRIDLSGKKIETPQVDHINLSSLTISDSNWKIPFTKESISYADHLYMLVDGKLNVYRFNDEAPVKSFAVSGEHFALLPHVSDLNTPQNTN